VPNLKNIRLFYVVYSKRITDAEPTRAKRINTVYPIPEFTLSWSHYLKLMRIDDPDERAFYEIESRENNWSLRELQRQFDSSLYERLALSRDKKKVMDLARRGQVVERPEDAVKDPYILEFTGLPERASYTESDLEAKLIDHLQEFMLELGKGFAFVGRQQRITFDEKHFFVDLVFFNRLLKCFVLVDLKRGELKHQDIGQMQMYVNYYDRVVKLSDENPTIGILLCHDKSDTLVEFSLPTEGNRIFASKYKTVLPSKTQLKRLISKDLAANPSPCAPNCQLLCKTHNRAKGNR
jgi:predicted nuclease of restriction endonuclease-like (RecB) superfamily